jgi:hypothetical protein
MAAIDHKTEGAAGRVRRFWQEQKEACFNQGLVAPVGSQCPYPRSSFAGRHWMNGANHAAQEV